MTGSWRRCDPEWTQMRMFGFVVFVNGFVILNELHSKAFFSLARKVQPWCVYFSYFLLLNFFVPNSFVFSDICLQLNFITIFYDFSPNYTLKFDELAQYCFLEKLHFELTFTARLVRLCV